jgi:uncharacterized membrane protein
MARDSRSTKKILSFLLIVAGLAMLFQGYQLSDSVDSQITEVLTGSSSDEVIMFYVGGVVSLIAGIIL